MSHLHLRPAPGARVRKPNGKLLADQGEHVPASPYFSRLLAAGDVEPVPDQKPIRKTATTRAKA
jgi:hypothetical protein